MPTRPDWRLRAEVVGHEELLRELELPLDLVPALEAPVLHQLHDCGNRSAGFLFNLFGFLAY